MSASKDNLNPLLTALMEHTAAATVVDCDHYRIRGGMAVETDYIIRVEAVARHGNGCMRKGDNVMPFETFLLSKTYSAFRTLGHQLKKATDGVTKDNLPKSVEKVAQYALTFFHLVEAERPEYLGKVNYNYVKVLAKKRKQIINEALEATLSYFPNEIESHPFLAEVAQLIETFLLLDHCEEADDISNAASTPTKNRFKGSFFQSTVKKLNNRGKSSDGGVGVASTSNESAEDAISPPSAADTDNRRSVELPLSPVPFKLDEAAEKVGKFIKKTFSGDEDDKIETSQHKGEVNLGIMLPPHLDTNIPVSARSLTSPVVPYTRKMRRSLSKRVLDDEELNDVGSEANLLLDDDRPPTAFVPDYSRPLPNFQSSGTVVGDMLENNPILFAIICFASILLLKRASRLSVTMDLDIELLLIFASFCIGLHTPRPMVGGIDKSLGSFAALPLSPVNIPGKRGLRKRDQSGQLLLRRCFEVSTPDGAQSTRSGASFDSMQGKDSIGEEVDDDEEGIMHVNRSPMPRFPNGAALGSHLNCWSEPIVGNFQVRGPSYLQDRRKVPSSSFLFPVRGMDLFLTDHCPENAGSNAGVFGGSLRDQPSFIINFRLPFGVLLCYFQIPKHFIPFVRAGYEDDFDKSSLKPLAEMSPSERCVARFLQGTDEHKNSTLKIVPRVVEGPWVVKSVVGGKPALIGNKLPVTWVYQRAEAGKAMYLEADLDIVASSAARGILSVARSYTNVLTLDLGFVVQGNSNDELPEQMLVGARLHGIDPMTAPPFPPSKDMFAPTFIESDDDEEDL